MEGVEGVASVSAMGMVDDNVQIVLSQDKIDAVNSKVAAAINSQMGDAEGQMKSGMAAAKKGKKQIQDGKKAGKGRAVSGCKAACCNEDEAAGKS